MKNIYRAIRENTGLIAILCILGGSVFQNNQMIRVGRELLGNPPVVNVPVEIKTPEQKTPEVRVTVPKQQVQYIYEERPQADALPVAKKNKKGLLRTIFAKKEDSSLFP